MQEASRRYDEKWQLNDHDRQHYMTDLLKIQNGEKLN